MTRSQYEGMTLNERLFAAGLLDAFNQAVSAKDRKILIELLIEVDDADAAHTVDSVIARCGF